MAPSKRRRRVRRVQRVKHGFLTLIDAVPLTKKGQQILKLLGAGNPASVVAKAVGCSRSNVSYWKDKFLSIGAIRLQVRDVVHIYRLTRYGSKILTILSLALGILIRQKTRPLIFSWRKNTSRRLLVSALLLGNLLSPMRKERLISIIVLSPLICCSV